MTKEEIQPLLIDREAAALMLGIGTTLLDQLVAAGEIPSVMLGTRRLFYPKALKQCVERLAFQSNGGGVA